VIVHLYEEDGPDFVRKLRGMFAIAIWDRRRRVLVLARDRLGIKPLYFSIASGRLLFASELKAILEVEDVGRRIHWPSLNHLLATLCTPPSQSIVEGVRKLEPGFVLVASPGRDLRLQRYWEFRMEPDRSKSEAFFEERLREELRESIDLHLAADVPVGAFLSGGIDSSSVVAMMAAGAGAPVKTFSVGFAEERFDEGSYARLASEALGTEHYETIVRADAAALVEELAWHLDEPFGDPSAIPTFALAKLASQHVKVVLSGDGGDEIFAGYERYLVERGERRWRFLPRPLRSVLGSLARTLPPGFRGRNYLRHVSLGGPERYLDALTLFSAEERREILRPEIRERTDGDEPWGDEAARIRGASGHWLAPLQSLDVRRYLPLDILTKVDRMSMAHSIEARVPLLDHKLVEFAATIPPEMNLRGATTKHLFKRTMRGALPGLIIDRPKQGFAVPLGDWFRGGLRDLVREVLLGEATRRRGIFEARRVARLIEAHDRGRPLELHLWTLMSFELWCRTFLDGTRSRRPIEAGAGPDPARRAGQNKSDTLGAAA